MHLHDVLLHFLYHECNEDSICALARSTDRHFRFPNHPADVVRIVNIGPRRWTQEYRNITQSAFANLAGRTMLKILKLVIPSEPLTSIISADTGRALQIENLTIRVGLQSHPTAVTVMTLLFTVQLSTLHLDLSRINIYPNYETIADILRHLPTQCPCLSSLSLRLPEPSSTTKDVQYLFDDENFSLPCLERFTFVNEVADLFLPPFLIRQKNLKSLCYLTEYSPPEEDTLLLNDTLPQLAVIHGSISTVAAILKIHRLRHVRIKRYDASMFDKLCQALNKSPSVEVLQLYPDEGLPLSKLNTLLTSCTQLSTLECTINFKAVDDVGMLDEMYQTIFSSLTKLAQLVLHYPKKNTNDRICHAPTSDTEQCSITTYRYRFSRTRHR
ncbi:hypothetical protein BDP27DRAFT_638170 [Rhodocollybia butyracea]|uniref:F-box domain-containing protein n=1 Tax=Rhodocollybia butyracea TaxID=206335 RepID=A0A9P5P7H3_9AGAR|nr:hypothetical protein BDP27DRAFT_638170 [Rhodocollybia butyracea]